MNTMNLFCSVGFSVISTSIVFATVTIRHSSESFKDDQHFLLSQKFACRHNTYTQNAFQDFKFSECTALSTLYKILIYRIQNYKCNINTDCKWFYQACWSDRTKRAYICMYTDTLKI